MIYAQCAPTRSLRRARSKPVSLWLAYAAKPTFLPERLYGGGAIIQQQRRALKLQTGAGQRWMDGCDLWRADLPYTRTQAHIKLSILSPFGATKQNYAPDSA